MMGSARPIVAVVASACLLLITASGCDKKSNDPGTATDPAADPSPPPAAPETNAPTEPAPSTTAEPPQPAPSEPNPGAPPTADVSAEYLDKFASAIKKVRAVETKYGALIKGAKSQQEAQKAQQEAMSVVQSELSKVGFTMEEYSRLAQQISADPKLQARLETRLE